MERAEPRDRWIVGSTPMRSAAFVMLLFGLQGAAYHSLIVLPAPFDTAASNLAFALTTVAASVGVLRAQTWGRTLGVLTMSLSLLWSVLAGVPSMAGLAAQPDALVGPALVWGLHAGALLFVLHQLVGRWPEVPPRPAPHDRTRTIALLGLALGGAVALAWLTQLAQTTG